jgi:hypothetical protein
MEDRSYKLPGRIREPLIKSELPKLYPAPDPVTKKGPIAHKRAREKIMKQLLENNAR